MDEHLPRKLAAILYADVAGYSRLTGAHEDATHRRLAESLDLISALVDEYRGKVTHFAGDAVLATFDAVVDAVSCAAAVQAGLAEHNRDLPDDRQVRFRIGVNLGDVIEDRGDVYGDGVNVAARLESLAEPGGICVSDAVRAALGNRLDLSYEDLGQQRVKNIAEPVHAHRVVAGGPDRPTDEMGPEAQEVLFQMTPDGVSLAYSRIGRGPVMVKAANWANHLEYEMLHPPWRPWWRELAARFELVRYDQRGNGLSDRDVSDVSFEKFVDDLETVVDALGLERFALLGISQGCAVSVAYAHRHPERVSHLILYGGYVRGWRLRGDAQEVARGEAMSTLIGQGWGQDNPAFRQLFTTMFRPDATPEELEHFNELQRRAASPEHARRLFEAFGTIDVSSMLQDISTPALVLHCRDDARAPFDEGRTFAARIPSARFVPLEGRNHLLAPSDASWNRLFQEIRAFVGSGESDA